MLLFKISWGNTRFIPWKHVTILSILRAFKIFMHLLTRLGQATLVASVCLFVCVLQDMFQWNNWFHYFVLKCSHVPHFLQPAIIQLMHPFRIASVWFMATKMVSAELDNNGRENISRCVGAGPVPVPHSHPFCKLPFKTNYRLHHTYIRIHKVHQDSS